MLVPQPAHLPLQEKENGREFFPARYRRFLSSDLCSPRQLALICAGALKKVERVKAKVEIGNTQ
jgi:hypothetical protein